MHLYAVATYIRKGSSDFMREAAAQKSKGLFAANDLQSLEEHSLKPYLKNRTPDNPSADSFYTERASEHHYIFLAGNKITVICSRTKLQERELQYLLSNISYVSDHPNEMHTLDKILINPLGYINRNLRTDGILILSNQVLQQMKNNLNTAQERGLRLDEIAQKTNELESKSNQFNKQAERLNSCCRF